jgi:tRNASer (uridine44-2'-O)-methyltransferase
MFEQTIKFLDLGCGNGLLTYILTAEGYQGLGMDMRRRRSWSLFDSSLFVERLIDPNSSSLHQFIVNNHYTFLIGNHSDELTPWLPVLACQCNCDVFLLPCCFFDFSGRKYSCSTLVDHATQYEQYLSYVERLARSLDFHVRQDKLRIPSTKNICFTFHRTDSTR